MHIPAKNHAGAAAFSQAQNKLPPPKLHPTFHTALSPVSTINHRRQCPQFICDGILNPLNRRVPSEALHLTPNRGTHEGRLPSHGITDIMVGRNRSCRWLSGIIAGQVVWLPRKLGLTNSRSNQRPLTTGKARLHT